MESRAHEQLHKIVQRLAQDYRPWGNDDRDAEGNWGPDCSGGCRFARWLANTEDEILSLDWLVCTNPRSHRCGLLTCEHQGCRAFESDEDPEPPGTG